MYLFLVVGHTGQGKTVFVNSFIRNKRQYVFDVNNEYSHLREDTDELMPNMRNTSLDVDYFLQVAAKLQNTNIVFEDATGFFRGKQSAPLIKQIVRKRHSKNNFLILFHSINRIPPELLEMANVIVLFKTNDNFETIDSKFHNEQLNNAFLQVRKNAKYKPEIIKLI